MIPASSGVESLAANNPGLTFAIHTLRLTSWHGSRYHSCLILLISPELRVDLADAVVSSIWRP